MEMMKKTTVRSVPDGSDNQGFCLWDSPGTTIEPYFGPAADYLDLVLSAPGGKVWY